MAHLNEGRAAHRLRLDDLVVESVLDLVDGAEDRDARVAVDGRVEVDALPLVLHLLQRLLERVLLRRRRRDLLELLHELGELHVQHFEERRAGVGRQVEARDRRHLRPVPLPDARVAQHRDVRQVLLRAAHLVHHLRAHLDRSRHMDRRLRLLLRRLRGRRRRLDPGPALGARRSCASLRALSRLRARVAARAPLARAAAPSLALALLLLDLHEQLLDCTRKCAHEYVHEA